MLSERRRGELLELAEPMGKMFKKYKNKELTESQLGQAFSLAGNEVRCVIAYCVNKLEMYNLINIRDKVYTYTTDISTLKEWLRRMEKKLKSKYIHTAKIKKMCKGA